MATGMIVINGGSSSGKSGIVRCLQATLPDPWLAFGVDGFVESLPASLQVSETGIAFDSDGSIAVGDEFRRLERAWTAGLVAMVRAGARIIVDDVFLGGAASQQRWVDSVGDLPVLWVGVRCSADVAAGRELARGDRITGMARQQAELVHQGVRYDVEVDTTHMESLDCAREIVRRLPG
jgi:chloramphenicol 3-O phosphotransferase